jgi:hypothetical protein
MTLVGVPGCFSDPHGYRSYRITKRPPPPTRCEMWMRDGRPVMVMLPTVLDNAGTLIEAIESSYQQPFSSPSPSE